MQQAIFWTSVDPDLCCHMASLGHNGLTLLCRIVLKKYEYVFAFHRIPVHWMKELFYLSIYYKQYDGCWWTGYARDHAIICFADDLKSTLKRKAIIINRIWTPATAFADIFYLRWVFTSDFDSSISVGCYCKIAFDIKAWMCNCIA